MIALAYSNYSYIQIFIYDKKVFRMEKLDKVNVFKVDEVKFNRIIGVTVLQCYSSKINRGMLKNNSIFIYKYRSFMRKWKALSRTVTL